MDAASSSRIESDAHGHVDTARGPVVYAFDGCRLAVGPRELSRGGRAMPMPSRVFDCLVYLVEHRTSPHRRTVVLSFIGHTGSG